MRVAAGDVNRDGIPDLVVAAGPGGGPHVKVYDGTSGELITGPLASFYAYDPGFTGGVFVASGDVDGDGAADVITSAGAGAGSHVKAFSSRTGETLASFYAFAPDFRGGATVAAADFTGDGKAELVVGAGAGAAPHVEIFDPATGRTIAGPLGSFYAFDPAGSAGVDVGSDFLAGDVTGDGRANLVVGLGAGTGSHVRIYDGVSGAAVADFSPFGAEMTAGVRVALAYVNDDSYADIVVAPGAGLPATVKVFDGRTLAELPAPLSSYAPFGESYRNGLSVGASNDPPTVTITKGSDASETSPSTTGRGWYVVHRSSSVGVLFVNYVSPPTGTATFTTDYSLASSGGSGGSIFFADGISDAVVYVLPVDDTLSEGPETVILEIASGATYTVGSPATATLTIADNDAPPPTVTIGVGNNASETDPTGAGKGWFVVHRDVSVGALTVSYAAPTGTAIPTADYTGTTTAGSATFLDGQSDISLFVQPVDDALIEGPETAGLALLSGSGYTLGTPAAASLTIADNDGSTVKILVGKNASETNPTTTGKGWFTFHRDNNLAAPLTVYYSAPTGTATPGSDYSGTPFVGSISFGSGTSDVTLDVVPVDDLVYGEGTETVVVALTANAGYTLGTPTTASLNISDNDVPPTITGFNDDTGSSASDRLTKDTTLTVFGTAGPTRTVALTVTRVSTGTPSFAGSTTSDSSGYWTVAYATVLAEDDQKFTATESQGGFTSAPSAPYIVRIDITPPLVTLQAPATTTLLSPDLKVTATDLNGLATTATLDVDRNHDGDYLDPGEANYATTSLSGGVGTFTGYTPFVAGTVIYLRARANDYAGNEGISASRELTVVAIPASTATDYTPSDRSGDSTLLSGNLQVTHALDIDFSPSTCGCQDAALVYNSSTADPVPTVQFVYRAANTKPGPVTYTVSFTWDGTLVSTGSATGLVPGGSWTKAFQPATAQSTGRHTYSVSLFADHPGTADDTTLVSSGRTYVVNNTASEFGAGWTFSNTDRLYDIPAAGANPAGKLLAGGRGGWSFYSGSGTFTSPGGDKGTLAVAGGGWTYTGQVGRKRTFDSQGNMTGWRSSDGSELYTYTYDAGQRIQTAKGWDGGLATFAYTSGKVSSISAAGTRITGLTVNASGDLTRTVDPVGGIRTLGYVGHKMTSQLRGALSEQYTYQ